MEIIPKENLAYPIKLEVDSNYKSTGFVINFEKESFFVTTKHSFYEEDKLIGEKCEMICQPESNLLEDIIFLEMDLVWLEQNGKIRKSSTEDVLVIKLSNYQNGNEISLCEGITLKETGESNLIGIPEIAIKLLKDVRISSEIFVQGYPESIGLEDVPQIDFDRPLVRKGIVAGINEDNNSIIIDCQIFKGNSGSPVIMRNWKGKQIENSLIGLVSQYIPVKYETKDENFQDTGDYVVGNSGYAVVIPCDEILKLI